MLHTLYWNLMQCTFTYTVTGWALLSGQVISSLHSDSMKLDNDTPGLARCCLWKTPRALRAPETPHRSDRTSSFDCPSNLLKDTPASIHQLEFYHGPVSSFTLTRQFCWHFFFSSLIWPHVCSMPPPSGERQKLERHKDGVLCTACSSFSSDQLQKCQ